jgi:hypothetical protein
MWIELEENGTGTAIAAIYEQDEDLRRRPVMRRILLMIPILAAAACSNTEGPREVYQKNRSGDRADLPGYNLSEQKQRGRERYTYIEDNGHVPNGYVGSPGGIGR